MDRQTELNGIHKYISLRPLATLLPSQVNKKWASWGKCMKKSKVVVKIDTKDNQLSHRMWISLSYDNINKSVEQFNTITQIDTSFMIFFTRLFMYLAMYTILK